MPFFTLVSSHTPELLLPLPYQMRCCSLAIPFPNEVRIAARRRVSLLQLGARASATSRADAEGRYRLHTLPSAAPL
jgi:hypothetical protein